MKRVVPVSFPYLHIDAAVGSCDKKAKVKYRAGICHKCSRKLVIRLRHRSLHDASLYHSAGRALRFGQNLPSIDAPYERDLPGILRYEAYFLSNRSIRLMVLRQGGTACRQYKPERSKKAR